MKYLKKFEKLTNNLISYVRSHDIEEIKKLIENGVNLNEQDKIGNIALHWATWFGYVDIIKMLVNAGADINIQNDDGETSLILAASYHAPHVNLYVIRALIDGGSDWSIKDNKNKDFLDYLNKMNKKIIIELYPEKYEGYLIKKDMEKYNL